MIQPDEIAPEAIRLLRRAEFDRMVEAGVFEEDDRIELLHGVLIAMNPPGPRHASTVDRLNTLLIQAIGGRALVRVQNPLAVSDDSEPEPDIAVVPVGDYDEAHPASALLVVEVSDATLRKDRELKGPLYAAAGVPEYWIVDVAAKAVHVHRAPVGGAYDSVERFAGEATIRLLAFPDVEVRVRDVVR